MDARYAGSGSPGLVEGVAGARGLRWILVRGAPVALAMLAVATLTLASRADAFVYWTESAIGTVGRANLDGSGANQDFVIGALGAQGVAVDSAHVYWTNSGPNADRIGRANLDGTGVDPSFINTVVPAAGVAVDGANIYWANSGINAIGRANLDGTGANQFFIFAGNPEWVAVDTVHVWWANGSPFYAIGRANLDGTGVNERFIDTLSIPAGVAVDALAAPSPGPGPAPPTITRLVADVHELGLPGGTERSLLAKLGAAQRNLDAAHLQAACGNLGAYTNEVHAQSHHRLDGHQAAELIAVATAIRQLLGCGAR